MERNGVSENKRHHLRTHLGPINHDHEFVRESGKGGVQHLIHLNLHILTSVSAPVLENKTTHPSIYLPPSHTCFHPPFTDMTGFKTCVVKAISPAGTHYTSAGREQLCARRLLLIEVQLLLLIDPYRAAVCVFEFSLDINDHIKSVLFIKDDAIAGNVPRKQSRDVSDMTVSDY